MFRKYVRNPKYNFDQLPFPDTRITHYYDADPTAIGPFTEAFPGVKAAKSLKEMVEQVDAVWLGDASGYGEDHFDLVAPALERGLPTFCDKPIGGTVAGTRKILEFARKHKAPIMSSSLFRHTSGAWRPRCASATAASSGRSSYVVAGVQGGYSPDGWIVYGQHPAWTVVTLLGAGVEAVSMYAREDACHALVTYTDRMPAEIWFGRPERELGVLPHRRLLPEEALRVHAVDRGRFLVRPPLRDVPHGRDLPRDGADAARSRSRTRRSWR